MTIKKALSRLKNSKVSVELKSNDIIEGIIGKIDAEMNIVFHNVNVKKKKSGDCLYLDQFIVKGSKIRFIKLPDDINLDVLTRN